jgi:hypothetical protein
MLTCRDDFGVIGGKVGAQGMTFTRFECTAQDFIGERVFDQPLNGTAQRTRTHRLVGASLCHVDAYVC